jgi:hypothetical protein
VVCVLGIKLEIRLHKRNKRRYRKKRKIDKRRSDW